MNKVRSLGQVGDPINPTDIANKRYVDSSAGGTEKYIFHDVTVNSSASPRGWIFQINPFKLWSGSPTVRNLGQFPFPMKLTALYFSFLIRVGSTINIDQPLVADFRVYNHDEFEANLVRSIIPADTNYLANTGLNINVQPNPQKGYQLNLEYESVAPTGDYADYNFAFTMVCESLADKGSTVTWGGDLPYDPTDYPDLNQRRKLAGITDELKFVNGYWGYTPSPGRTE